VICVKCGTKEAGELSPEMRKAKERLGMPLTPPKVCPECLWTSLLDLENDDPTDSSSDPKEGQ
jgi:hypothetical protein